MRRLICAFVVHITHKLTLRWEILCLPNVVVNKIMNPKDADGMANSVDTAQTASAVLVHTVCLDLTFRVLWIVTVISEACIESFYKPIQFARIRNIYQASKSLISV